MKARTWPKGRAVPTKARLYPLAVTFMAREGKITQQSAAFWVRKGFFLLPAGT